MKKQFPCNKEFTKTIKFNKHYYNLRSVFDDADNFDFNTIVVDDSNPFDFNMLLNEEDL